ncbi:MAG: PBP1A family penicillin-binding protein [Spirochaetaceae bacterium]|nr:MAG: PBP1A family penicillin-binding protein [Spirochaetaceae bacterium]
MDGKWKAILWSLLVVLGLAVLALGVVTGIVIASVESIYDLDSLHNRESALPSQILDRHGRLITEFFSDENRELVSIDELPRHLIYALITREDQTFFEHRGFSFRGTARAAWNLLTNQYVSGGSTITQQLAGHLYADRTEFSVYRKIVELWWALQLERHWTKYEILEAYLNRMWFGHGNYGVEAASQFFFGHSARDLTVAESAMLVIQLANPSLYSPIRRPNQARVIQSTILNRMVQNGYATQDEVDLSLERYWSTYDFTRANTSTAFFEREDRAPYFSEYIRHQLENRYLLGSLNINTDGYVVHTTLDLDFQASADRHLRAGIARANSIYRQNISSRVSHGDELVPIIDLLALTFDLETMEVGGEKARTRARQEYQERINPVLDALTLIFGTDNQDELRHLTRAAYARKQTESLRSTVEGALIAVENDTGHIMAMLGGREFESRNQFNRAVDGALEPGSAFKPLYYAAALENRVITPATMIYDAPVVFRTDDGEAYTPLNFRGEWAGPVLVRNALSRSMNVPSLKILDMVGFTSALDISASLLGIPEASRARRGFERRYPVGLGVVQVSPLEMASAFATFANQGRRLTPIAIRYIEDRTGRVIMEPEAELRREERRSGSAQQIISPQTAYVMTDILQTAVQSGTLVYARNVAGGFEQPTAGKTGTTQNWGAAWTVGYTPYYTSAVWLGFDRGRNNSLGVNQTGAITAGPIWSQFMKDIHKDLPRREFVRPEGIVEATVTARSGLLPPADYAGRTVRELFIAGTQPTRFDELERFEREQAPALVGRLRANLDRSSFSLDGDITPSFRSDLDLSLNLDMSFLPERDGAREEGDGTRDGERTLPDLILTPGSFPADDSGINPLLD